MKDRSVISTGLELCRNSDYPYSDQTGGTCTQIQTQLKMGPISVSGCASSSQQVFEKRAGLWFWGNHIWEISSWAPALTVAFYPAVCLRSNLSHIAKDSFLLFAQANASSMLFHFPERGFLFELHSEFYISNDKKFIALVLLEHLVTIQKLSRKLFWRQNYFGKRRDYIGGLVWWWTSREFRLSEGFATPQGTSALARKSPIIIL